MATQRLDSIIVQDHYSISWQQLIVDLCDNLIGLTLGGYLFTAIGASFFHRTVPGVNTDFLGPLLAYVFGVAYFAFRGLYVDICKHGRMPRMRTAAGIRGEFYGAISFHLWWPCLAAMIIIIHLFRGFPKNKSGNRRPNVLPHFSDRQAVSP